MTKTWHKRELQLKPNHTWKGKPGYKIFVADRGAIRLNFPQSWIVKPAEDCIQVYDVEPPNDNCVLAVSYLRLLPGVEWSKLPLAYLLQEVVRDDRRNLRTAGKVRQHPREDLEVAWMESTFIDPEEKREAISYIGLARGFTLQSLLTFDFWPEHQVRLQPVWDEVIRSLQLGPYLKDPTVGDILH
jgi:hypothetical protein